MDALFELNTPKSRPKRRVPDPQPRLSKHPRWATCKCGQRILEALGDGLQEVAVDPINLTLLGIQACSLLRRPVFRSEVGAKGEPVELWWVAISDLHYYDHHKYYWLPTHVCGLPLLPHTSLALTASQTLFTPNQPPF